VDLSTVVSCFNGMETWSRRRLLVQRAGVSAVFESGSWGVAPRPMVVRVARTRGARMEAR